MLLLCDWSLKILLFVGFLLPKGSRLSIYFLPVKSFTVRTCSMMKQQIFSWPRYLWRPAFNLCGLKSEGQLKIFDSLVINVLNSENNLLIILKMPEIWSLIVEKWKVQLFNPHSVNKMLLSNHTSLRVSHHCCSYRFFLSYGESLILGIHILLTLLKVHATRFFALFGIWVRSS